MQAIPKRIKTKEKEFAYWEFAPKKFNKTIFFFPSGASNGDLIKAYNDKIFPNTRWIGIDYPGRGMLQHIKDQNQISQIAKHCVDFITHMKVDKPVFFGHSFGTAVITETLRYNNSLAHLIVMIQSGEYLGLGKHQLVNTVFSRTLDKPEAQKKVIKTMDKINEKIPFFKTDGYDLNCINAQLLAINNYQIDTQLTTKVKTLLIHSKKDEIIIHKSRKKLKEVFLNRKELLINRRHTIKSDITLGEFNREMLPLAADWIFKNY